MNCCPLVMGKGRDCPPLEQQLARENEHGDDGKDRESLLPKKPLMYHNAILLLQLLQIVIKLTFHYWRNIYIVLATPPTWRHFWQRLVVAFFRGCDDKNDVVFLFFSAACLDVVEDVSTVRNHALVMSQRHFRDIEKSKRRSKIPNCLSYLGR